jgi:hypothetical protein
MKRFMAAALLASLVLSGVQLEATAKPASSLTYNEIVQKKKHLTDVQFEEYAETIKGQTIIWIGWVRDVDKGLMTSKGMYKVRLNMSPNGSRGLGSDLSLEVPKAQALKLRKGQRIKFSADIDDINDFLGLNVGLEHVKLM